MRRANPRLLLRRVPFIAQMEMTECGAASLGMVLAYHGCAVPLTELREACGVSRDGSTALDVCRGAERFGLSVDAVRADTEALDEVELPAIIHWEFNHFVVLERWRGAEAVVVDPALGRRTVSLDAFGRSYTGVALQLRPGATFQKRRAARRSLATCAALFSGALGGIGVVLLSALLLEVLGLLFPAATAFVVDFVIRPRQARWLPILGIDFSLAIALRAAITLARERIVGGVETRLDLHLATTLVKHVLTLPVAFFAQRGTGDLLVRVESLLEARERFARVMVAAFDVLLVGAYGALMLVYDVRLGGVVVALHLTTVLVTLVARARTRNASMTAQIAGADAQSALVQTFSDPETVKAFGTETLLLSRYASARTRELNAQADAQTALEPSRRLLALLDGAGAALVLWIGGDAVIDQRMTLGVLSSFLALQALLGPPLARVVAALQDLASLVSLLERVDDVLQAAPEPTGEHAPGRLEGAISLDDVSFRYGPHGPLLLDRVSFHVAPGERVAIVGASGAGKSTLIKLILGFVQPVSGAVRIDGRDVRDYDFGALRSSIGAVLAGGAFFDATLFDNVALGARPASPGELHAALDAACVADVVAGLPQGSLTRLDAGARRLSGGQRQRVLLARALVKNPSMLLLDEASSALDAQLEARVLAHLRRVRCTTILVAHRLSALSLADRVLVLQDGKIVQDGAYATLAAQAGPFRELLAASEEAR